MLLLVVVSFLRMIIYIQLGQFRTSMLLNRSVTHLLNIAGFIGNLEVILPECTVLFHVSMNWLRVEDRIVA